MGAREDRHGPGRLARQASSGTDRPESAAYSSAAGGAMDGATLAAFLARPLIARLATSRRDVPRVVPMWFEWDGRDVWMETHPTFPNARILRVSPRAALAIDESDGGLEFRAVVMRGSVEVIDGPEDLVRSKVRQIYVRYLGAGHLDDPTPARMLADRHVLLRFTPSRIVSWVSHNDPG